MPAETATLFRTFRRMHAERPFIVAQLGQSLDGRIATRTGDSRYIGAAPSLDHLHRIRAHVDAVVVGIGTVQADDPQLNVRRCTGRNPARIVIDARGKLSPAAKCLAGEDGARRIVFRDAAAPQQTLPDGVELVHLAVNERGHFALPDLARAWARLGFDRVLIEGGAGLVSQAIDAGIVDRLHLMVSPMILGSGLPGLQLAPIDRISQALGPRVEVIPLGDGEVLFDCEMTGASQGREPHG